MQQTYQGKDERSQMHKSDPETGLQCKQIEESQNESITGAGGYPAGQE